MKGCIDPKIGQMIGLYEFNKLSPEEKTLFEKHLLECDACYQEFYEFIPVVKTINTHIGAFKKATNIKKSFPLKYLNKLIKNFNQYILNFRELNFPSKLGRVVMPTLAAAILVFFIIRISLQNQEPQKVAIHEPDQMEKKTSYDEIITDPAELWGSSSTLDDCMKMDIKEDKEHILFSWYSVVNGVIYHVTIITDVDRMVITPEHGITDTCYVFSKNKMDIKKIRSWELSGRLINGRHFRVYKDIKDSY